MIDLMFSPPLYSGNIDYSTLTATAHVKTIQNANGLYWSDHPQSNIPRPYYDANQICNTHGSNIHQQNVSTSDFIEALSSAYNSLEQETETLDTEIANILYKNLWDLYDN